jgi:hypothetical protein
MLGNIPFAVLVERDGRKVRWCSSFVQDNVNEPEREKLLTVSCIVRLHSLAIPCIFYDRDIVGRGWRWFREWL